MKAQAQKPDLIFQRNRRVHLNWRGCHFSRLLAAKECVSADSNCIDRVPTYSARLLATHSFRISPSLPLPCVTVCHQVLNALYLSFNRILKVKWSRYRPGVTQRVGRGIALLFHDRGTRRGWVASSTPRRHFTPGKDPLPILQEAGWAPGPVWTGGKSRLHRNSIPDRPARSQSLYQLNYPAHFNRILVYQYTVMKYVFRIILRWFGD